MRSIGLPKRAAGVTKPWVGEVRDPAQDSDTTMTTSTRLATELRSQAQMADLVDSRELGELFRKYGPAVCRRAHRILGSQLEAQEATQEIFLRALSSADRFEGKSQLSTWLYQITTHFCLNQLRNRRRRQELLREQSMSPEPESSVKPAELILLRQLLAEADEQQARAAICVYLDELTHQEAAEVLGVSPRTVGNLIDRFCAWAKSRVAESENAAATRSAPPRGRSSR